MVTPANGNKYNPQRNLPIMQVVMGSFPAFVQFASDYFMLRTSRGTHTVTMRSVYDAATVSGFCALQFKTYWAILTSTGMIKGNELDGYCLANVTELEQIAAALGHPMFVSNSTPATTIDTSKVSQTTQAIAEPTRLSKEKPPVHNREPDYVTLASELRLRLAGKPYYSAEDAAASAYDIAWEAKLTVEQMSELLDEIDWKATKSPRFWTAPQKNTGKPVTPTEWRAEVKVKACQQLAAKLLESRPRQEYVHRLEWNGDPDELLAQRKEIEAMLSKYM